MLHNHKNVSLATFIAGFDIEGYGETLCEKLVNAGFNTLDKLLEANQEQIASVYGFADISAKTIVQGLKDNSEEMKYLVEQNIISIKSAYNGKLTGKSFCFTGELKTMKRAQAENLVKQNGGSVKSSVTKDLSYLVTNEPNSGSSKNIKAKSFGIPVICSEIPVFKEIGHDSIEYFNLKFPNEIHEKIKNLINNKDQQKFLQDRGYQNIKQYHKSNLMSQINEVIK